MVKVFKTKRTYSIKEKLNVIFETFSSFTDFSLMRKGYAKVGRSLDINPFSVRSLVLRFIHKYKSNIDLFMAGSKLTGRPIRPIGNPDIEKHLLSESCLKSWVHLTIKQRCVKIKKQYAVDVGSEKLRHFYLRNGVR